jgi:hypothetical protein
MYTKTGKARLNAKCLSNVEAREDINLIRPKDPKALQTLRDQSSSREWRPIRGAS